MASNVIIIGAGGHAKVIADIIECSGDNLIGFLDDDPNKHNLTIYKDYKVLGTVADVGNYRNDSLFIIAIGDATRRSVIGSLDVNYYTAIHPQATVANTATIGEGSAVMAGAVINVDSVIGRHCIINTSSSIDHDNSIADYVHVSPGAHLAGSVSVGEQTWICTGATVINGIHICKNTVIGAGATVIRDINDSGIYVGTPARRIK